MSSGQRTMQAPDDRIPILYLAPWVDIGGSDKGTIDWFRCLDRSRFRPSLITTQPSPNRRLGEVVPYAEELWELPQLMAGDEFPRFILAFIQTRRVQLVHLMNSRLGFELLPDIASLPDRPRIVVQLHAEEPNRAGYVRYVTTRYGNLVDAFSLSNEALSTTLLGYEIPGGKRRLIRTGVDAEGEFCPTAVHPTSGLDPTAFHILFPARLTAQKDPLLMIEVAERLRAAGLRFQIHVLGDGDLMDAVTQSIATKGLGREVVLHGACVDVTPWYAACDAVLLTSAFEGLPYVAYEAMAMKLPIVCPHLPGLDEVITAAVGVLVAPRDDAGAYADALSTLAGDPRTRTAMGEAGRTRALSEFSLRRMAAEHESLYDELLSDTRAADGSDADAPIDTPMGSRPANASSGFGTRPSKPPPLVSVIVTCFNQGLYLDACLRSVAAQTYQPIETIIVDDRSTDPQTLEALASAERDRAGTILRLPTNQGPSAARNAAIEHARGRYVLPLDGDDLLIETAVADLVDQLSSAGEQIEFIYPNLQFFGNRNDYLEMPSYNLYALLRANLCPVSSLIDYEVFARGFRYAEDLRFGHEDWDFALTLAEHGIYGEAARTKTLRARKHGFTRSDLVEISAPVRQVMADRHPGLFARRTEIKAEWNPALTLVSLDAPSDPTDLAVKLPSTIARQTCPDFELFIRMSHDFEPTGLKRRLREVPLDPLASRAQVLAHSLESARGRYVLAAYGSLDALLADPALIEKALRTFRANPALAALALGDADLADPSWRGLDDGGVGRAALRALCWQATGPTAAPSSLRLSGARPLESLARWIGAHGSLQWRHLSAPDDRLPAFSGASSSAMLGKPRNLRASDEAFREAPPALPDGPPSVPYRLRSMTLWRPPQTRLLMRYRHHQSGRYVFSNRAAAPDGYVLDHALGCVREFPLAGTASLRLQKGDRRFAIGEPADLSDPALLGFVERLPLPLLDPLLSGRDPATGQWVLVAGQDDPLAGSVEDSALVGYVEPYPIRPRAPAHIDVTYGLVGLVRTVDLTARHHRYGAGHQPTGVPAGELGALFTQPTGECDPLWINESGRVRAAAQASPGRPTWRTALRWTGEPLTWSGFSRPGAKVRATARRALDSARILTSAPAGSGRPSEPAGYLLRSPTSRTVQLYAAIHAVTGDQLLTTDPSEATALGYGNVAPIGHLIAQAPVTGSLGPIRPATPWAARFGLVASA